MGSSEPKRFTVYAVRNRAFVFPIGAGIRPSKRAAFQILQIGGGGVTFVPPTPVKLLAFQLGPFEDTFHNDFRDREITLRGVALRREDSFLGALTIVG